MKLSNILWLIFCLGIVVEATTLYLSRASCYNEDLAILQGELKDPARQCTKSAIKADPRLEKQCSQIFVDTTWQTKKCEPSINLSEKTKHIVSHIYFIGFFVLPILLFLSFIFMLKERATRKEDIDA